MLKRLLPAALTLALLAVPLQAAATDYTDIGYLPSESGCGSTAAFANSAFTSVMVCAPGSSTKRQNIDNIPVDTRSWGLRPHIVGAFGALAARSSSTRTATLWSNARSSPMDLAGDR